MTHLLLLAGVLLASAAQQAPATDSATPTVAAPVDDTAPAPPAPPAETPPEPTAAAPAPAPESARQEGVVNFYVADPSVVKMPDAVKQAVAAAIAQTLEEEGYHAFARDDVREILTQAADLANIGAEADGLTLGTLGAAVGADYLVACVISQLNEGGATVVQMRLIDVPKARVLVRREASSDDHEGEVLAAVKDATRLILAPLFADLKGSLALSSTEDDADVLIDGTQIGVTPISAPIALPGGHHTVLVRKEGFVRYQETVKVEQGAALKRDVILRPSPAFAQAWREEGELFRSVAWAATGGALVLAGVGAGFGAGWYYFGYVAAPAKREENAELAAGIPASDERALDALNQEVKDLEYTGTLLSVVGISAAAVGVAAAGTAAYFWIFGKDPGRYTDFENAVE